MALLDETNWKMIMIDIQDPLAFKLNSKWNGSWKKKEDLLTDVEGVEKHIWPVFTHVINAWLCSYKSLGRKSEHVFAFNETKKKYVFKAHEAWKKFVQGTVDEKDIEAKVESKLQCEMDGYVTLRYYLGWIKSALL